MRMRMLIVLALLLMAGAGFYLFSYPVDDEAFIERGWRTSADEGLEAAAAAGWPVLLKFGKHT